MRIEPIERPRHWLLRLGYWMARRQLGAVPSSFKVIYARAPRLARAGYALVRAAESGLSLDPELKLLILTQSSRMNGCSFCADLHLAQAVQARIGLGRFQDLEGFRASPRFSAAQKAALAYTEEITRDREVADETFAALREHFDDVQIVEITWLNALGNYYNLMAVPLQIESDDLLTLALERAA
jgi:AhpD family alkylhydroperoxidase